MKQSMVQSMTRRIAVDSHTNNAHTNTTTATPCPQYIIFDDTFISATLFAALTSDARFSPRSRRYFASTVLAVELRVVSFSMILMSYE